MTADKQTLNQLTQMLNLRADEAQTLGAVFRYCSAVGMAPGAAAALGMAGVGTVMVPGIGGVPGWLVGFAAGWVGGAATCTMAQRGVVIEGLKKILREAGQSPETDHEAVNTLRTALGRASLARAA